MTDQQDPRNEQYDRVRDAFDSLPFEDKTIFLLKETVNTIVQSVEGAARSIIDEFEGMFAHRSSYSASSTSRCSMFKKPTMRSPLTPTDSKITGSELPIALPATE